MIKNLVLRAMKQCKVQDNLIIMANHGEKFHVNITLEGCLHPAKKLVQFITSKKHAMQTKQVSLIRGQILAPVVCTIKVFGL